MWMFMAILFIIAQIWKQPNCLHSNGWMNKQSVAHPCCGILLSTKKNKLSVHTTWMKLRGICQMKGHVLWLRLYNILKKIKASQWRIDQWLLAFWQGDGEVGLKRGHTKETILCLGCGSGHTPLRICQDSWNCTPRTVTLTVSKFKNKFKILLKNQCTSVLCTSSLSI